MEKLDVNHAEMPPLNAAEIGERKEKRGLMHRLLDSNFMRLLSGKNGAQDWQSEEGKTWLEAATVRKNALHEMFEKHKYAKYTADALVLLSAAGILAPGLPHLPFEAVGMLTEHALQTGLTHAESLTPAEISRYAEVGSAWLSAISAIPTTYLLGLHALNRAPDGAKFAGELIEKLCAKAPIHWPNRHATTH